MRFPSALTVPSLLLVTTLAGCHVSSHKNGDNDNVNIGTPFGSMHVKTNDNVAASGLGITPYPGAQLSKKHGGEHSDGSADVNMSVGNFHLGVKAVSYTTPDVPDKVLAFYKKDLGKYGTVLQCEGGRTVGETSRTPEGLTCDHDSSKAAHMNWKSDDDDDDDAHKIELRTGSKTHQHIVAIEPKDGGSKIGLISLDLPGDFSSDSHKDSD
jgi:hypothetical protein